MTRLICELKTCMFYYIPEQNEVTCVTNNSAIVKIDEDGIEALLAWCRIVSDKMDKKKWEKKECPRTDSA